MVTTHAPTNAGEPGPIAGNRRKERYEMTKPETITLPRSGLVLRHYRETLADFVECDVWRDDWGVAHLYHGMSPKGLWEGCTLNDGHSPTTFEECVRLMDESVLEIRATIMPPDARDRIIAVLDRGHLASIPSDKWDHTHDAAMHEIEKDADAILVALGVGEDE